MNLLARLYAVLLHLYPRAFRDKFAEEMTQVFADDLADTAGSGRWALATLCWREAHALPAAIVCEHLRGNSNMKTKAFYLFVLLGLIYVWWWSSMYMFGTQSPTAIVWTIVICLLALVVLSVAKRANACVWIYVGLGILVALCLPDSLVVDLFLVPLSQPRDGLVELTFLIAFCAAFIITALLFQSSLNLLKRQNASIDQMRNSITTYKHSGWISVIALALSVMVLVKAFHSVYWFMVWDTTGDSLGNLWLLSLPIPAVLFSSFVLFVTLSGRTKLIGVLYLLLIPALTAVSDRAQNVDFRQLTEERAEQVSQAIETFRTREGRYPHDLRQLVPWHIISLPSPVIIYAQGWCYDGGDDYYRLGYVNRNHWSDPDLHGQLYQSNGKIPDLPSICTEEIATLEKRYAGFRGRR
jgi:type II secretory pathway pseudopilin PulG